MRPHATKHTHTAPTHHTHTHKPASIHAHVHAIKTIAAHHVARVVRRHHTIINVTLFVTIAVVVVAFGESGLAGITVARVTTKVLELIGDCVADRMFPARWLGGGEG